MSLSRQGLGGDCSHQEVEPSVLADLFTQVPVCQLHNQGLENCLAEDDLPVLLIFLFYTVLLQSSLLLFISFWLNGTTRGPTQ